ncbi:MAG: hypothetical protein ACKVT1_13300 [Dehalococcoidia bacterium]
MMSHRLRQFREASLPPSPEDVVLGQDYLEGALRALFEGQHPRDIRHSAATARWLLDRGHSDRDLILAALLHDVAKGAQRRGDRVVHVVAGAAGAGALLANQRSRFEMRRALHRSLHHAEAGARLLDAAGAPARAAMLTRLHHSPAGDDPVLALLIEADAAN